VSHFAYFPMAHFCPLGPRVRMNCSKLSALTTRGRFHGVSLDLLLFLELVYRGPQQRIYFWIRIWFELPVMVLKVLSPLEKVWLCRLGWLTGLFARGTFFCEAGRPLGWAIC
jgi:hypothetical protein